MSISDLPGNLQRIYNADPTTESDLKAKGNLDPFFHQSLIRLLALKFDIDPSALSSYKLAEMDENTRNDLKTKVKAAMASPRETGSFRLVMETNLNPSEERALRFVEFEGLLALGMLGDEQVIPLLLKKARDYHTNTRKVIFIGLVLRHLTGQDIGGYFL